MSTTIYIGPPGCGKTTKLSSLVTESVAQGRVPMVSSLTRAAAAEVSGRNLDVPKENIGTLHAHAFAALGRPQMTEKHLDDWNAAQPGYELSGGRPVTVDDPYTDSRVDGTSDELMNRVNVLRARMVPVEKWPMDVLAFYKTWCKWKMDCDRNDFTDLIDRALTEDARPTCSPDIILIDEAQDLSRLELALTRKWANRVGRDLVIVGDPYQALYTWRGAAPEMFFSDKVAPGRKHVLSQSYRIPRAVHKAAMAWLSGNLKGYIPIEYRPRDADGETEDLRHNYRYPEGMLDTINEHLSAGQSVMVCASCGYLLNPLIAVLKKEGIPFANPWRTKRGDWNPLSVGHGVSMAQRLRAFLLPTDGIRWKVSDVAMWADALRSDGTLAHGTKRELREDSADHGDDVFTDHNCWQMFRDPKPVQWMLAGKIPVDDMLSWYHKRVLEKKERVTRFPIEVIRQNGLDAVTKPPRLYVGTIHSFKGSEADVVMVFPDLSYRGMCSWVLGGEEGYNEIVRMFYVAFTRAREKLYVCEPASQRSVPIWEYV